MGGPVAQELSKFSPEELALLKGMDTPQKIQDFLDTLDTNFEPEGDTVLSPLRVLRERRAHCIEAAMFAALCLRLHNKPPLIVDLTANSRDDDHVICVFRRNGCWGAIAKSNHYCLGYRDPIYKSIRELVASYFHEYLNLHGEKTLRSYSKPINLSRFDKQHWMTSGKDVWCVPSYIIKLPHTRLMTRAQESHLRKADEFTKDVNNLQRQKPQENKQHIQHQ
jgi:hypothetical protein